MSIDIQVYSVLVQGLVVGLLGIDEQELRAREREILTEKMQCRMTVLQEALEAVIQGGKSEQMWGI